MGLPVASPNVLKPAEDAGEGFAARICLPFLHKARNADGGWGYRPGTASAVEPTAWSLLALAKTDPKSEGVAQGLEWLLRARNDDGSWPTRPETAEGNWVTPLAALAVVALNGPEKAIAGAAQWLCQSRSGEHSFRMWLGRLVKMVRKSAVEQDFSLQGWSWTPGTASWVEPTALALIFLHHVPPALASSNSEERRRVGEALLYDRMCPGGGWNSGNPMVYGVGGIPQIGPTAWALLALQEHVEREENRRSLDWLAGRFDSISGSVSIALAHLALEVSGRPAPAFESKLETRFDSQGFLDYVPAFAQAAFALGQGPDVLRWTAKISKQ
jgi:hypothetical protein